MFPNPLFKQRSKQFPNLTQFLESMLLRERAKGARVGLVGGIAGTLGGLFGTAIGIWSAFSHTAFSVGALVATILGINVAVWVAILFFWLSEERKARQRPQSEVHRH